MIIKNFDFKLFFKYLLIAGIATLVDLSLLLILTDYFGIYYLYSSTISYICGMIINYSLNKSFNFKNKNKKIFLQFGLFTFVALIGLGLNQLILLFLVESFGFWYMHAKIISILIVMFWSFFGHKKITFGLLK